MPYTPISTTTGPGFSIGVGHMDPGGDPFGPQNVAYGQPGAFAGALGNMGGAASQAMGAGIASYNQGVGTLGGAQSALYQNYFNNLANLQTNRMASMGQAEVARQVALSNLATTGMTSYGQMMGQGLGAISANATAAMKANSDRQAADQAALAAYSGSRDAALAGLGSSYANLGGALSGAYGNLYGAASTAAGNYGGQSAAARASALASLGRDDQNAYMADLNYARDMAKLGLAREIGTGQLSVASQGYGTLPAATGAIGGALGGLNLSSNGAGGGTYASGSYGMIPAPGGGYNVPPTTQYGGGREWYQNQQQAPGFNSRIPGVAQSMDNADQNAYAAIGGNAAAGGQGIANAGAASYGGIGQAMGGVLGSTVQSDLMKNASAGRRQADRFFSDTNSNVANMTRQGYGGLQGMLGQGYGQLNAGMNQYYGQLGSMNNNDMSTAFNQGAMDLRNAYGKLQTGGDMGFGQTSGALANLWNQSMGKTNFYKTPVEQARDQAQLQDYRKMRREQELANRPPVKKW